MTDPFLGTSPGPLGPARPAPFTTGKPPVDDERPRPPHTPVAPRHRAQRPGPGVQLLLRRTRLTTLVGLSPAVPPVPVPSPLVLLGRPGTTPDSIPHLPVLPPAPPTAALRTATPRVLLAALVAADPDENSLARRRAAATGLHPVDDGDAPALAYRVKPGDDLEAVARLAGCSGRAVLAANGMRPGAALKTGQLVRLPALAPRPRPRRRPAGAAPPQTAHDAAPRREASPDREAGPGRETSPGRETDTTREQAARRRRTRRGEVLPAGDLPHRSYPAAVTLAAAANRRALERADVPDRATVRGLVRATAVHFGLDPALALAVASMESGFDHRLVSPANAIGVMQVLPSAGAWAGELLGRPLDLLDTKDNITAGVVLLLALGHHADEQTALAGYYQGLASVRRHGTFPDTRRYVATVRTLKLRFR